jgi:plastocyanin
MSARSRAPLSAPPPRALAALGAALLGGCALGLSGAAAQATPWGSGARALAHRPACHRPAPHRRTAAHRCRARHRHAAVGIAPPSLARLAPTVPVIAAQPPASPALTPALPAFLAPETPATDPAPAPDEPPVTPPSIPHVQVTAAEYSFTLSRSSVPAGKVVFEFVNGGQDEHNLNIEPGEEGSLLGSFPTAPAKAVSDLQLEVKPGTYTLFCSLPHHESRGMKATLLVE